MGFKQCGSMSSTDGCGPEDIRRSIQSLCQQCDQQAGNNKVARSALNKKCDEILSSAPAAPMSLYSIDAPNAEGVSVTEGDGRISMARGIFALGLAFPIFSVGLVLRVMRNGCNPRHEEHREMYTREGLE